MSWLLPHATDSCRHVPISQSHLADEETEAPRGQETHQAFYSASRRQQTQTSKPDAPCLQRAVPKVITVPSVLRKAFPFTWGFLCFPEPHQATPGPSSQGPTVEPKLIFRRE